MLKNIVFFNSFINKLIKVPDKWFLRWRILVPACILLFISVQTLYYTNSDISLLESTFTRQFFWIGLGCLLFIAVQFLRIQFLNEYAYHLYFLLFILLFTSFFMPVIVGTQRWIKLGALSFQPSEIGKLLLVIALAKFIADNQGKLNDRTVLFFGMFFVAIPVLMVFKQPDFGTAIVYAFVAFPMFYWGGIKPFYIFSIIAPLISIVSAFNLTIFSIWMIFLILIIYLNQPKLLSGSINFLINISFGIVSPLIWNNLLYEHQRNRISTLINPMGDPQGAGYQVIQSITAIGSGGLWGKGLGEGTQTQLRYLPVRDTDFIISVIGEEMGLLGIFIILISLLIMLYWIITYAGTISNRFSSLILIGFSSIFFIHMAVNMGMTVGMLPVTGLPAPFISYGGSFLLTCVLILAIANNIINQHT